MSKPQLVPAPARRPMHRVIGVLLSAAVVASLLQVTASGAQAVEGGRLTVSTTEVEFDPAYVSTTTSAGSFVLKNESSEPLVIRDFGIVGNVGEPLLAARIGADVGGPFAIDGGTSCGRAAPTGSTYDDAIAARSDAVLPAWGSCVLALTFAPVQAGEQVRWLRISTFGQSFQHTVTLLGEGRASGVDVTPAPVVFAGPGQPVGTLSQPQAVTIANTGAEAITVNAMTSTNEFPLGAGNCVGRRLEPGAMCRVDLAFRPTAAGLRTGALTLTYDGPGGQRRIPLSGGAVSSATVPAALTADRTELPFPPTVVGSTSPAQLVTITNTSSSVVELRGIGVEGTPWDWFVSGWVFGPRLDGGFLIDSAGASSCRNVGPWLWPGVSCAFTVSFRPLDTGHRARWLEIRSALPGGPLVLPLTGTGTAASPPLPGALMLSADRLDFGGVPLGTPRDETVTVTNTGAGPLTVHGHHVHGTVLDSVMDHTVFSQDKSGGFSNSGRTAAPCAAYQDTVLAPADSCTIAVRFLPREQGRRTRWLSVSSNAPNGTQAVELSGEGQPGQAGVELGRDVLDFGKVAVGTSAVRGLVVTNIGTAGLAISGATVPMPFSLLPSSCTDAPVEPGEACLLRVAVTPTAWAPLAGTMTLQADAPGGPHTVELRAVGTSRAPQVRAGGPYRAVVGRTTQLNPSVHDPDGDPVTVTWDLDGNGTFEAAGATPEIRPTGLSRDELVTVRACDPSGACAKAPGLLRIRVAGPLLVWGPDRGGALGLPADAERSTCAGQPCVLTPTAVPGLDDVTDVAVSTSAAPPHQGGQRTTVLRADGTVWTWSSGAPAPQRVDVPTAVALASGDAHELVLTESGEVWGFGYNGYGALGGSSYYEAAPRRVTGLGRAVAIAAGRGHSLALLADGSVWGWGVAGDRQLGGACTATGFCEQPVRLRDLGGPQAVAIAGSSRRSVALHADGRVWAVGGLDPDTSMWRTSPVAVRGLSAVTGLSAGSDDHLLARRADGTVWGVGDDGADQLGGHCPVAWNVRRCETGQQLPGLSSVRAVVAGGSSSAALGVDGSARAWGANGAGQLGTGSTSTSVATPTALSTERRVMTVALQHHGAAVVAPDGPPTDTTAPVLTAATAPQVSDAWSRTPVTVSLGATDDGSGVESVTWTTVGAETGSGTVTGSGTEVAIRADGTTTLTATARDRAGNTSAVVEVVVRVDTAAPTATVTAPGGRHVLSQHVLADYHCEDAASGIASCTGPVPDGAAVPTTRVGSHAFPVTGTDRAGHTTTVTSTYQVGYALCAGSGALPSRRPVTASIRVQLCDASGANVSSAAVTIAATTLSSGSTTISPVPVLGTGRNSNQLTYDAASGSYGIDVDTRNLSPGTWTLRLAVAGDPLPHSVTFSVR